MGPVSGPDSGAACLLHPAWISQGTRGAFDGVAGACCHWTGPAATLFLPLSCSTPGSDGLQGDLCSRLVWVGACLRRVWSRTLSCGALRSPGVSLACNSCVMPLSRVLSVLVSALCCASKEKHMLLLACSDGGSGSDYCACVCVCDRCVVHLRKPLWLHPFCSSGSHLFAPVHIVHPLSSNGPQKQSDRCLTTTVRPILDGTHGGEVGHAGFHVQRKETSCRC